MAGLFYLLRKLKMKKFDEIDFSGKKVIMRVDFNVPLNEKQVITDDTRIRKALPTIKKIISDGGSVVLMSHLGRPKQGPENKFSLSHITDHLGKLLNTNVAFANDCISEEAYIMSQELKSGEVLLLENLRFYGEEKAGDREFAKKLSQHAVFYVNDAFGTAHRAHASTSVIAQFFENNARSFGYLMEAEISNANKVIKEPKRPVTAIVGGAKVSDKIKLLENLIQFCDNILIGGGMAYTFIKAKGGDIGNSLCEDEFIDLANKILNKANIEHTNIYLPIDSIIANEFSPSAQTKLVSSSQIPEGWMGLDIGPEAMESYSEVLLNSKTILWNGPMGVFEFEAFSKGTFGVANSVANATKNGAFSLIGGGDSVSAINKAGLEDQVSYVSTGGGAMLEFLEGKSLPGIEAILK